MLLTSAVAVTSSLVLQTFNSLAHSIPVDWHAFRDVLRSHDDDDAADGSGIKPTDYLLAIPLGILGGTVGSVTLLLTAACHWTKSKVCRWLHYQHGMPLWFGPLLLSVSAGCFVAAMSCLVSEPWMVTDDGSNFMPYLLKQSAASTALSQLLTIIGCRTLGLALVLGLGWFGGPVFPLASIGLCSGLVVSKAFACVPSSLAVPCCMASVLGSVIPVPFAIVTTLLFLLAMDLDQGGPMLVSTLVAHGVTGGVGLVRYCGQRFLGVRSGYSSEEEDEELAEQQLLMAPTDDEILRDIRSAIFGGPSS